MTAFKRIFTLGCVINTVLMTGFYLLAAFLPGFDLVPSLATMLTVLALSFIVSAAEGILRTSLAAAARVLLHYALCAGSFMAFFIASNSASLRAAQVIIAAVFFTLIYVVAGAVRYVVFSRGEKRRNEDEDYTPAFKKH